MLEGLSDGPRFGHVLDQDHCAHQPVIQSPQRRSGGEDVLCRSVETPDRERLAVRADAFMQRLGERAAFLPDHPPAAIPPAQNLTIAILPSPLSRLDDPLT